MTCQNNTIKNTVIYLLEFKSARTLNDVKHDSCETWRVTKELLATSPKRSLNHAISLLETDGENFSNAEDIANTSNNYFSTIGEKLAKNIEKHDILSYTHFLKNRISSSFF